MAGAVRGRPRSQKQTKEVKTPTKAARGKNTRVELSDDEDEGFVKVDEVGSDKEEAMDVTPLALLEEEADDDEVAIDTGEVEEEDEIPDEGEEVESDIEKIDASPDYVAFTRPSTSPVRGRKGITIQTPPTPSPTKNSKKRQAPTTPVSDDVLTELEDDEDDVPESPVKSRKPRTKKNIKSQAVIEDSDIEEISESQLNEKAANKSKKANPTPSKATRTTADKTPSKATRTSVTVLDKKIVVKGTKFPSAPVEDVDNNVFLDGGSPLLRSPKKKQKMSHQTDSEDDLSDADVSVRNPVTQGPETPSVSRIADKLHSSVLTSAKKPSMSASQKTHVENIRKAMGMRSVKEYFCSALINTYGAVRIADVWPIQMCQKDPPLTWFTLRSCLTTLSIAEGSKQERNIVNLITGTKVAPFIYNPARCDFTEFHVLQPGRPGREFIVPEVTDKKSCFVLYGAVRSSSILEPTVMGSSLWYNRNIAIYPLAVEFVLAYNFFRKFYDQKNVTSFRDYIPISTKPMKSGADPVSLYKGKKAAPPPSSDAPTIHRIRADEHEDDLLWEILGPTIEGGGLEASNTVPVFDLRDFYGCMTDHDIPHSMDRLVAMCAWKDRFEGEIPAESLVGVLCMPMKKTHIDHVDLTFNLVGVILLSTPYGTSIA